MITINKTETGYQATIDGVRIERTCATVALCLNDAYGRVSDPVSHFIEFVRAQFLNEDQIVPINGYQSTDLVYYSNSTEFYKCHYVPLWLLLEESEMPPLKYLIEYANVDINDQNDFMHAVATCGLDLAFMGIESDNND